LAADQASHESLQPDSTPAQIARQSILIQKAQLYEKLRKGDHSGLTEGQKASLNVDFDAKAEAEVDWGRDESARVPRPHGESSDEGEEYSDSEEEGPQPATNVCLLQSAQSG